MDYTITNGIKVTAKVKYQPDFSKPLMNKFVFSYTITIENKGIHPVQLLRRHWYIFDSNGQFNEVEGAGIVGEQPVIEPGDQHTYNSWCPLKTEMGLMYGNYSMQNMVNGVQFKVKIPQFQMITSFKLN